MSPCDSPSQSDEGTCRSETRPGPPLCRTQTPNHHRARLASCRDPEPLIPALRSYHLRLREKSYANPNNTKWEDASPVGFQLAFVQDFTELTKQLHAAHCNRFQRQPCKAGGDPASSGGRPHGDTSGGIRWRKVGKGCHQALHMIGTCHTAQSGSRSCHVGQATL